MIEATKTTIKLLRQWGKLSNVNRSEKIAAFNFAFIDGREKNLKARLGVGQELHNIDRDVLNGFINDYFVFLVKFKTILDQLPPETVVNSNRINFYPVTIVTTEDDKRHFKYQNVGATDIAEVYQKIYQYIEVSQSSDMSSFTEDNIPPKLEESIKFFRQFISPKVKYLIVRTRLAYTIKINENGVVSNSIAWHVIGSDESESAEAYKLMDEFKVIPFDTDLGKIEELKL